MSERGRERGEGERGEERERERERERRGRDFLAWKCNCFPQDEWNHLLNQAILVNYFEFSIEKHLIK